jgi:hypothetical protein
MLQFGYIRKGFRDGRRFKILEIGVRRYKVAWSKGHSGTRIHLRCEGLADVKPQPTSTFRISTAARAKPTWRILDSEPPGSWTGHISYSCPNCDAEALLPVMGRVLAQLSDGGLVFDRGEHHVPSKIQCRFCKHSFESDGQLGPEPLEGSLRDVR